MTYTLPSQHSLQNSSHKEQQNRDDCRAITQDTDRTRITKKRIKNYPRSNKFDKIWEIPNRNKTYNEGDNPPTIKYRRKHDDHC